uniref:Retrovirus-related Pol polyprotein from type-1 retrotransposable element R1 n=1 Tax=Schizaphis graminum TaxID=13262 RepID=A0A2S2NJ82_SCHGA
MCSKGEALMEFASSLGLIVINQGKAPTYESGGYSSHIDVTFASASASRMINSWQVLELDMASDHHPIFFRMGGDVNSTSTNTKGWSWRRLDKDKLTTFLKAVNPVCQITFDDAGLVNFLEKACDSCMPRRSFKGHKKPVHWWTEKIANLRKASFQARRKYQKARKRKGQDDCSEEHQLAKDASKALRLEIRRSQEKCWADLCKQVDTDPWGLPFKLITKKLIGRRQIPGLKLPGRLDTIVNHLFPCSKPPVYPALSYQLQESEMLTTAELAEAGRSLPRGKAPGPDGVPDEVLRVIVQVRPDLLLPTFNDCLKKGVFLDSWKVATLVLLRKGDKPLDQPSSYRPLCLINSVGKLFERLLKMRITRHLLGQPDGISEHQFGFMRGRSTNQAIEAVMNIVNKVGSGQLYNRKLCALASLDVANAFNSAPWERIDAALIKKRVPAYLINVIRSYFNGRRIITDGGQRLVTTGVPQGSVIGPILWNIFYDELMRLELPDGVNIVCFADDAAVVATGYTTRLLEEAMNDSLQIVSTWMKKQGLSLSSSKSVAIMLTTKRGYEKPSFQIGEDEITLAKDIRYLGVQLSSVLGFRKHIQTVSEKSMGTATRLCRLMPNVGGPIAEKRKLLMTVVHSQLLYAAPIWSYALKYKVNKKKIASPQRNMALRVASAYCTVSNVAIMVISGILPIHLLAAERAEIDQAKKDGNDVKKVKKEARDRAMTNWQCEWDQSNSGRWTYKLIPRIDRWKNRKWGQVNFYVTQFLSGHGCFNEYLLRWKKRNDAECMYCGDPHDDAEHTFIGCDRWWQERRNLEVELGVDVTPERMVDFMLQSKSKWDTIVKYITTIMKRKEADERKIQTAAVAD